MVFGFLSVASSDFLFLARVRAVYYTNKLVGIFFALLWIGDVSVLGVLFAKEHIEEIADTKHCINISRAKFVAATLLVPLFFDTMVYVFITAKFMSTPGEGEKIKIAVLFSRKALPRFSRAILQSGQQYYL